MLIDEINKRIPRKGASKDSKAVESAETAGSNAGRKKIQTFMTVIKSPMIGRNDDDDDDDNAFNYGCSDIEKRARQSHVDSDSIMVDADDDRLEVVQRKPSMHESHAMCLGELQGSPITLRRTPNTSPVMKL